MTIRTKIITTIVVCALAIAALVSLGFARGADAAGRQYPVTAWPHQGTYGVEFHVCNHRTFPKPWYDQNDFSNDYAIVHVHTTGGSSPDPTTFELGAPHNRAQHCTYVEVHTRSRASIHIRIRWYRDGSIYQRTRTYNGK